MSGSIDKPQLDWLSSKVLKFIVGPEAQEFMVHSALVAEQSKPLHALVTNGMKESLEGIVKWPQVDVATFKNFSEYLYTRDFMSPCFEPLVNDPSRRGAINAPQLGDDEIIRMAYFRFAFRRRYGCLQPLSVYMVNSKWYKDYKDKDSSKVFSSVAKVYIFAHYYDIQELMTFCRAKIHRLMSLAPDRGEVFDLLQLCKDEPAAAGLKKLVFEYCALCSCWLLTLKRFHTIIEEYPEAALGIMKKMKSFDNLYLELRPIIKNPEGYSSDSDSEAD